jgi:hypothetical protein
MFFSMVASQQRENIVGHILGNIRIGHNVKIGSGSVVVKAIPDNCTAVGSPARILPVKELSVVTTDKEAAAEEDSSFTLKTVASSDDPPVNSSRRYGQTDINSSLPCSQLKNFNNKISCSLLTGKIPPESFVIMMMPLLILISLTSGVTHL